MVCPVLCTRRLQCSWRKSAFYFIFLSFLERGCYSFVEVGLNSIGRLKLNGKQLNTRIPHNIVCGFKERARNRILIFRRHTTSNNQITSHCLSFSRRPLPVCSLVRFWLIAQNPAQLLYKYRRRIILLFTSLYFRSKNPRVFIDQKSFIANTCPSVRLIICFYSSTIGAILGSVIGGNQPHSLIMCFGGQMRCPQT